MIYDPNSPFNILGIPFLGDYFGAKDTIPNRDDDGTYVRSSASKTTFVWDHGQHSQDLLMMLVPCLFSLLIQELDTFRHSA